MGQHDRTVSLTEASSRANHVITSLGLKPKVCLLGNQGAFVAECLLFTEEGNKLVAKGLGKGLQLLQAETGAKFEALENYTALLSTNKKTEFKLWSMQEIHDSHIPILLNKIPPELLDRTSGLNDQPLAWVAFQQWHSGKIVYVPALETSPFYAYRPFSDDHFNYSKLYHAENGNGTAIGCSFEECFLYAILEVLERDAVSLFLAKTFLAKRSQKIKLVDQVTLPGKIQNLISSLSKQNSIRFYIIELESDFNLPTYCATIHAPNKPYALRGYAASFDPVSAVQAAILEATESYLCVEDTATLALAEQLVGEWPAFGRCVYLDVPQLITNGQYQWVEFHDSRFDAFDTIADALMEITFRLEEQGFEIYYHHAFAQGGIHTIKVMIPRAEELCVIEKGLIVAPKERIQALLSEYN